jgi:hypothetical protein
MNESKALQRQWSLLPSTMGEAMEMAKIISESGFAPKGYAGKAYDTLIAIQMGADVGLAPMQSLQNIAVINGRPTLWGDAALALAMPVLEKFQEYQEGTPFEDGYRAVCRAKRKGWPDETIRTFSVAQAKKANLWGKANTPWQTYPDRMLQMRARGFCLRDVAPDRLMGFILAEEAMDIPTEVDAGSGQTPQARSMTVFLSLPEPMRDNIEKAFLTLNLSEAQRLQRLNEFLGGENVVAEEAAEALLNWTRDEFAKRRTGMPRAKADGNKKKQGPKGTHDGAPEELMETLKGAPGARGGGSDEAMEFK